MVNAVTSLNTASRSSVLIRSRSSCARCCSTRSCSFVLMSIPRAISLGPSASDFQICGSSLDKQSGALLARQPDSAIPSQDLPKVTRPISCIRYQACSYSCGRSELLRCRVLLSPVQLVKHGNDLKVSPGFLSRHPGPLLPDWLVHDSVGESPAH